MLFKNPSSLSIEKMRELIGMEVYRDIKYYSRPPDGKGDGEIKGRETAVIKDVFYQKDFSFDDIICGYDLKVEVIESPYEIEPDSLYDKKPPYTETVSYPINNGSLGDFLAHLPQDYLDDIREAEERVKQWESENEERLSALARIPVEQRIIQRYNETKGTVTYGLCINLHFSFHGSYHAVFRFNNTEGQLKIKCYEVSIWDKYSSPLIYELKQEDIDGIFNFYKSFDFFSHKPSNRQGLDGWSIMCKFHDGNTHRVIHSWCPEKGEEDFRLAEFVLKYLKLAVCENDYNIIIRDVKRYSR